MGNAIHSNGLEAMFVYGTLKSGHMYHDVLSGFEGEPAFADGFELYRGPGYPYAVRGEGRIHGELYIIDTVLLTRLDALEGYPELFDRVVHDVRNDSGEPVHAWVYCRKQAGNGICIPSGIWTTEFEYEEEPA